MFLHRNNLGPFSVGAIVRCTVYWYEGKPQAKNLEEASPSEGEEVLERIASGGMTDMMSMTGITGITGTAGMTGMTGMPGMTGMIPNTGMTMGAGMTMGVGMTTGPSLTAVAGHISDTQLGRFVGTARSSVNNFCNFLSLRHFPTSPTQGQ